MEEHLSRELFRAIATGWRNPGDLASIALAHLFELCPACRKSFEAWRQELQDSSRVPESIDYEAVIDQIRLRVEDSPIQGESRLRSEIRKARSVAEEVLQLEPEEQVTCLRSEARRLSAPLLTDVLIEEARRRTPNFPRQGFHLASLARLVLQHTPTSRHTTALYARAMTQMANAVRVVGDLPRADQLLGDARYFLRSEGGGDRLVRAELDRIESALRTNLYSPNEAIPLFLRALMTYRLEDMDEDVASCLIGLAGAHRRFGDPLRGLALLSEAERIMEPDPNPWLELSSLQSRVWCLCQSGEPEQANEVFEQRKGLYDRFDDPMTRIRRFLTSGRIAWKLHDLDLAEKDLLSAREVSGREGLRFDQAQASFDLGWLYLEQGRHREAEVQADEALPIFEEIGLRARVGRTLDLRAQAAAR